MRKTLAIIAVCLAGCAGAQQAPDAPAAGAKAPPKAEAQSSPAAAAQRSEKPPLGKLPGYLRPTHYQWTAEVDPRAQRFSGSVDIDVTLEVPRSVIWLHGRGLHVTAASAGGQAAKYEQVDEEGVARLSLSREAAAGKLALHLEYDAPFNPTLAGLYVASSGGERYASTQMEPTSARLALPCFDEPLFKTPWDLTVIAPQDEVVVGNTNAIEETKLAGGRKRVRFATTQPLPSYLVLIAVGPFDVRETRLPPNGAVRKRPLTMRFLAPRGRGAALGVAMEAASALLPLLENYFGREFPYDKLDHLALPDFEAGAMENAGAITYRETALLFTPGKSPEDRKAGIAEVIAHEMAHQWFGDLVTLRWWEDIWLNESFATWLEQRVVAHWQPGYQAPLDLLKGSGNAMNTDSLISARRIRQPIESNGDIQNAFDGLTYQKGGALLAMFERYVGAEKFREGIRRYIAKNANGSGSTDDLLASISAAAGHDIAAPFHTFLDQPGVPLIEARVSCDGGVARLALKQSRYLPTGSEGRRDQLWKLPVCARYSTGGALREACVLLEQAEGELLLPGGACPAWVMPNADGAGYYRWSLARPDLRKLRSEGYTQLTVAERISFAAALRAGLNAGTLPAADVLAALEPIAHDTDGAVATEPLSLLRFTIDRLAGAEQRKARALASSLYRPVAAKLGWAERKGELTSQRRLREQTLSFLALRARDPEVLEEAARRGQSLLHLKDGKLDFGAVDRDLAPTALAAAVRTGGAQVFDRVDALFTRTTDAETRELLLGALSLTDDPALARRALSLGLDSRLRADERTRPLIAQLGAVETESGAFAWLQQNLDAYLAVVPEWAGSSLPLFANFCDRQKTGELSAFFRPRVEKIHGSKRPLANALEATKLCTARAEAQRKSAQRFLHNWVEQPPAPVQR